MEESAFPSNSTQAASPNSHITNAFSRSFIRRGDFALVRQSSQARLVHSSSCFDRNGQAVADTLGEKQADLPTIHNTSPVSPICTTLGLVV